MHAVCCICYLLCVGTLGELTKLCVYSFWFMVSGIQRVAARRRCDRTHPDFMSLILGGTSF